MWRLLEDGELLRRGDEYWQWNDNAWNKINPDTIGCKIPLTEFACPYRRKISQENIERNDSGKERQPCGENNKQIDAIALLEKIYNRFEPADLQQQLSGLMLEAHEMVSVAQQPMSDVGGNKILRAHYSILHLRERKNYVSIYKLFA